MNIHHVWIIVKILAILLFFSGIFIMIRFFMVPDTPVEIAIFIGNPAIVCGGFVLFYMLRVEYKIRKELKDDWTSFWDPWWDPSKEDDEPRGDER